MWYKGSSGKYTVKCTTFHHETGCDGNIQCESWSSGWTESEFDKGFTAGFEKGKGEGYKQGLATGFETGKGDGYKQGLATGFEKGKGDGYEEGLAAGFEKGKGRPRSPILRSRSPRGRAWGRR